MNELAALIEFLYIEGGFSWCYGNFTFVIVDLPVVDKQHVSGICDYQNYNLKQ